VSKHTVDLMRHDFVTGETVKDGEVSLYALAKCITQEQMAYLLDSWANNFSATYGKGKEIGAILTSSHRTLQRSIITVLVGIISGLSEQDYTDIRNAAAIALAKQIKALYDQDGTGPFV